MNTIPMLDLEAEVRELWPEIAPELERVIKSAQFIMGPEVAAFEREIAAYLGVTHAIAVNSGTDALVIALQALGVGPGDEVITTPFTFVATGSAILRVGAIPVFCDIEPESYNISPDAVRARITARTRAIIPVHLFGHAANMQAIAEIAAEHELLVIEDVAQALSGEFDGAKLGTFGDAAAFSFFPSKNLGACGDGGMLVVRADAAAQTARMLRVHGAKRKYYNEILGYNSRLDSVQAAILRVKLRHLAEFTSSRQRVAAAYSTALAANPLVEAPRVDPRVAHAFHQYTVRVPATRRDRVRETLTSLGIASMVYYPKILTDLPIFAACGGDFPEARRAASEVLSLPIWPHMPQDSQARVVEGLRSAVA